MLDKDDMQTQEQMVERLNFGRRTIYDGLQVMEKIKKGGK